MWQLFRDTHIDFLGKRPIAFVVSGVLLLGSIGLLATRGLNYGIDFAGGTEVQVKLRHEPDVKALRAAVEEAFGQSASIQRIGAEGSNEVLVRVAQKIEDEATGDVSRRVIEALHSQDETSGGEEEVDLNAVDVGELTLWLARSRGESQVQAETPDEAPEDVRAMAQAIAEYKREHGGLIGSLDELDEIEGLTADVRDYIRDNAYLGDFAVRRVDYVGPSVGQELREKALRAVLLSLGGILLYIWFRFELVYAVGAIVALAHDVLITLGAFSVSGLEFSLPVVAAVLTIVGYSLNDTIVVYDRIRENRLARRVMDLLDLINKSINQTLGRTVLTSFTTLCVVLMLYIFGGVVVHNFAFALLIGVLIGTYSSVFVASPVLLYGERIRLRRSDRAKQGTRQKRRAKERAAPATK